MHSRISRPRHLVLPLQRQLLVLLHSTTNTVVSMLGIGIPIKTLLLSLTLLFKNTMEYLPAPNIHLIWMFQRSKEILVKMCQFTPVESVLADPLMDLVFPQE